MCVPEECFLQRFNALRICEQDAREKFSIPRAKVRRGGTPSRGRSAMKRRRGLGE